MSSDYALKYDQGKSEFAGLSDAIPETTGAFGKLHQSALAAAKEFGK